MELTKYEQEILSKCRGGSRLGGYLNIFWGFFVAVSSVLAVFVFPRTPG